MARLSQTGLNINVRTSLVTPDSSTYNGNNILFDINEQKIGIQGEFIYGWEHSVTGGITGGTQIDVIKTGSTGSEIYTISHASITTTQTNIPTAILATGGKFQVINGLQFDNNGGHVTGVTVSEYQLPEDSDEKVKAYTTSAKSYILGHVDLNNDTSEYAYKTSTHYIQDSILYQDGSPVISKVNILGSGFGNVITKMDNSVAANITAYYGWALTGIALSYSSTGNYVVSGVSYTGGIATLTTRPAELTDEKVKSENFNGKVYLLGHTSIGTTGYAKASTNVFMSNGSLYADNMYVGTSTPTSAYQVATKSDIEEVIEEIGKALHFDDNQTLTSSLSTTYAEKPGEVVILSAAGVYTGTLSGFTDTQVYEKGDIAIAAATGTGGWVVSQANLNIEDGQTSLSWGATTTLAKIGNVTIDAYLPENPNTDDKVTSYATSTKTYLIGHATIGTNAQAGATSTVYIQNDTLYASHVYSDGVHVVTGVSADTAGNTIVGVTLGNHGNVTLNKDNRLTNTGAASGSGNVVTGLKTGSNWEVIPIMGTVSDIKVQSKTSTSKLYILGHTSIGISDIAGAATSIYMENGILKAKQTSTATSSERVLTESDITWNLI